MNMETSDTEVHVVVIDHKKLSHRLSFENDNFEDEEEEEEDSYGIQELFQIESPKKNYSVGNKVENTNIGEKDLNFENNELENSLSISKETEGNKEEKTDIESENEHIDESETEDENDIFSIDITLFVDNNSDSIKILVIDSEPGYHVSSFDINGDSITECQICFSTLNNQSVAFCIDCHYEVCFDCLSSHIEYQVKEGVVEITCPGDESCIKSFSDQFIAAFASEHINSLLIKNKVEAEQNPNVKTCPGCHKIERKDENVKNVKNKKNLKRINCSCGTDWCFECYSPWHSGLSCAKYQNDVVQHGDKALRYWAKSKKKGNCNNAKRCPKCHFYIERISGCNHMTCNRFDINFYYFIFSATYI